MCHSNIPSSDHVSHNSLLSLKISSTGGSSVAAPKIWNECPIKSIEITPNFCKNLKTYFLEIAFPPSLR